MTSSFEPCLIGDRRDITWIADGVADEIEGVGETVGVEKILGVGEEITGVGVMVVVRTVDGVGEEGFLFLTSGGDTVVVCRASIKSADVSVGVECGQNQSVEMVILNTTNMRRSRFRRGFTRDVFGE